MEGVVVVVVYMVGCVVLQQQLQGMFVRQKKMMVDINNVALASKITSSINAVVIFVSSCFFFYIESTQPASAMLGAGNASPAGPAACMSIQIMLGYIIVDTWYDIQGGMATPSMLAHHLVGFVSETAVLYSGVGGRTMMQVHVAEASTPLLHMVFVFVKFRWHKSYPVSFNALVVAMFITFFGTRVVWPVWVLGGMLSHQTRLDFEVVEGPAHAALYWFQVGVVVFWWMLNCYWFVKLLQIGMGASQEAGNARERPGNAGTKNAKSE